MTSKKEKVQLESEQRVGSRQAERRGQERGPGKDSTRTGLLSLHRYSVRGNWG